MSTAKARYLGDGSGERISNFSTQLRMKLREFYPNKSAEKDRWWGHPAETFHSAIINEAWNAKTRLAAQKYDVTKSELRAEQQDLLKGLQTLEDKLRNLSPGFGRLLAMSADPLGCADEIGIFAHHISALSEDIEGMSKAKKPIDKQHAVAIELGVGVLRILQEYDIPASATGDTTFSYTSDAVQILKLIGDDLGLVRDELTWRDIIIKAKEAAPDLQ